MLKQKSIRGRISLQAVEFYNSLLILQSIRVTATKFQSHSCPSQCEGKIKTGTNGVLENLNVKYFTLRHANKTFYLAIMQGVI